MTALLTPRVPASARNCASRYGIQTDRRSSVIACPRGRDPGATAFGTTRARRRGCSRRGGGAAGGPRGPRLRVGHRERVLRRGRRGGALRGGGAGCAHRRRRRGGGRPRAGGGGGAGGVAAAGRAAPGRRSVAGAHLDGAG